MTTIVTIPNCSATQLMHDSSVPLTAGVLEVIADEGAFPLTLKMNDFAFPLSPNSQVFTHSHSPLWYFFKFEGVKGTFVKITLPIQTAAMGTDEEKLRDQFEEVLIGAGMLKTGMEAVGDEVGAGVKEDAAQLVAIINSGVRGHIGSHPATTTPAVFSSTTHSIADGAAAASGTVADYAASATKAFVKGTIGIGESVVNAFNTATEGPVDPRDKYARDLSEAGYSVENRAEDLEKALAYENTLKPAVDAVSPVVTAGMSVANGVADASSSVTSAVGAGTTRVIDHEYGAEAADLSTKTGETAANVKNIAKSTVISPISVAKVALSSDEKKEEF